MQIKTNCTQSLKFITPPLQGFFRMENFLLQILSIQKLSRTFSKQETLKINLINMPVEMVIKSGTQWNLKFRIHVKSWPMRLLHEVDRVVCLALKYCRNFQIISKYLKFIWGLLTWGLITWGLLTWGFSEWGLLLLSLYTCTPKVPLNHDMNWRSFGNKGRQLHLYYYEANKRNNQLNTFISLFRLAFKSYAILLRYCAFQSESTFLNFLSEEGVITIA